MTENLHLLAYSIPEVCRLTQLGESTVRKHINLGNLVAIKVGRRTLVTAAALQAWFDAMPKIGE